MYKKKKKKKLKEKTINSHNYSYRGVLCYSFTFVFLAHTLLFLSIFQLYVMFRIASVTKNYVVNFGELSIKCILKKKILVLGESENIYENYITHRFIHLFITRYYHKLPTFK